MSLAHKGRRITLLGLVLLAGVYVRALAFTPLERFQGPAQKLFFLFIGYLLLRGAVVEPGLRARYSAVLGICGLVLLPFIHLSVYLFRTLHPQPIVLKPSSPSLPGSMLVTLLVSFAVFTLLYVGFVTQRYALALQREAQGREHA